MDKIHKKKDGSVPLEDLSLSLDLYMYAPVPVCRWLMQAKYMYNHCKRYRHRLL